MISAIGSFLTSPTQGPAEPDTSAPSPTSELFRHARKYERVITANIEVTHRCNQRCSTCFLEDYTQAGLTPSQFERVLEQLHDNGTVFVSLTGGEVFTRPDALDLIAAVTEHDLIPEVKTNGILITSQTIERLAQLQLQDLQVSIYECKDGWSTFTKTNYSLTRLLATIQELQAAGVPVTASILVGKHNIDELPTHHERLVAAGIKNVFYNPYLTPSRTGNPDTLMYRLSAQELHEKLRPFLIARGAFDHPKRYRGCGKHQPTCYAGRDQIAIGPNGNVYPCLDLRVLMGNVIAQDLRDILRKRHQHLAPFLLAAIPKCAACAHKTFCDSCVGTALLEHGDFRVPSQHKCDVTELYCSANQRKEVSP
jgi:radical SAM protein with 4Fe4S-binding SPASM domain